jgi:N-carbamoylputrescine amidase
MIPVVASNRVGTEILLTEDGVEKQRITFYGRSFITNPMGGKVEEVPRTNTDPITILTSTIHPSANRKARVPWGFFRDRRPELYRILQTSDGVTPSK